MRIARNIAVVAVAAVTALGLTACGGKDDPGPSNTTKAASQQTGDSQKNNADEDPVNGTSNGGATLAAWTDAISKTRSYRVTMDMGSGGKTSAAVDLREAGNPKISMDTSAEGVTMKTIIIDKKIYLNMGSYSQNKYYVIDSTDGSAEANNYAKMFDNLDISATTSGYEDALVSIEEKGDPITIDGVSCRPYVMTIDTSKLTGGAAVPGASLPSTTVTTYYVGDDNLPRRIVSSSSGTELTMEMTDWGKDMNIQAPSASEITDKNPMAMDQQYDF